jgi:hypothetical protein
MPVSLSRRSVIGITMLAVLLALPLVSSKTRTTRDTAAQTTASVAQLPLLQQGNMSYVGAFRVPQRDGSNSAQNYLTYGGTALSYNAANHSLYFGGHDWYQRLCEVRIPAVISLSRTASLVHNCVDVTEGRLGGIDEGTVKLGGTLPHNGRLIVSAYSYYDADTNQTRSHFVSGPNLAQTGDVQGPFQVGTAGAGFVSGYMAAVPPEWRSLLGGPALTGNCCLSIISRTSAGPAVSVFNPNDVGRVSPVPATPLLAYPLSHPLAPEATQNDLFNTTTQIAGVAFPPGTRSVLFFGVHGSGPWCYGTGGDNGECHDPAVASKGPHAYPYVHQVWAYDALDLLAVKNGQRQRWELRPYATWRLTEMNDTGDAGIAGAAYDPTSGRLYLTERYGEEPVVHVYQITASGGVSTATPTATASVTATATTTATATAAATRTPAPVATATATPQPCIRTWCPPAVTGTPAGTAAPTRTVTATAPPATAAPACTRVSCPPGAATPASTPTAVLPPTPASTCVRTWCP